MVVELVIKMLAVVVVLAVMQEVVMGVEQVLADGLAEEVEAVVPLLFMIQ